MPFEPNVIVRRAVTINRPREEVFARWTKWEELPNYMRHLQTVEDLGGGRTRWRAHGPTGDVNWEAETVARKENELVSWRSLPGADVPNAGEVRFADAPGGRGTELRVEFGFEVKGGKLASVFAKLTGEEPTQQVAEDLRRFKAILETGEFPAVEGGVGQRTRDEENTPEESQTVGLR